MKRKMSILFLALLLVALSGLTVFGQENPILIDGKNQVLDTEIYNARSFISSDSLTKLGLKVELKSDEVIVKDKLASISFKLNSNQVKVNQSSFSLDTKAHKKDGKVYLPFRFLFETLNYKVTWNQDKKLPSLSKQKDPSYPVVFDNDGVKYKVDKEAETIVSLAPDVTETLFDLGAGNKIKGRTIYCNYPKEALKIPEVGSLYEPSIETVVDINPNLVIAATHYKEDVLNKFKEAGINIFAKNSPNTLEEMYDYTLVLGNIVNRNYEARALVSSMKAKVSTVEMYTKNLKNKPSVYYVVGTGEYGEYTAGANTFTNDVIMAAGAINIAGDSEGYGYSLEKLIDKNPSYIFGPKFAYDTMKSNKNYSSLSALKNNNFIVVDEDIFVRPSQRLIDQGLKIFVKTLHPSILEKIGF